MKYFSKIAVTAGIVATVFAVTGCGNKTEEAQTGSPQSIKETSVSSDKVYVALEEDGAVAVIDVQSKKLAKKISLDSEDGQEFMAHNVQVAPDGKSVWVTANAMEKDMHGSVGVPKAAAAGETFKKPSELIIIDPVTDTIIARMTIGSELELAHVVLTPDSKMALTTSQKKGIVFIVDAEKREILKQVVLDAASEPHGLRVAPDGSRAYVALLKGKGMAEISMQNFEVSTVPLNGQAVQTAVTPDGKKVVVTLYDTKKLAVYNTQDRTVQEIALPDGTKGPLQLYPTSDSRFVYVADQGYYLKQPEGDKVFKVDLETAQVSAEIQVGKAPHGVVVSKDGAYVFVTNLRSNDVSMIDAVSNTEVAKIRVGNEPNGISYWSGAGTPYIGHAF